jgi:hypothetical protein
MMQPDLTDPMGIRDRAILEVLYSTGIRRMEVLGLKLTDLDAERGTLLVRQGKGKKDRMVPVGERAITWLTKYLEGVRSSLVVPPDEGFVFLTNTGEAITPNRLTQLVREYDRADIKKRGSCHLFRHTMATLMLENGADIRFIQGGPRIGDLNGDAAADVVLPLGGVFPIIWARSMRSRAKTEASPSEGAMTPLASGETLYGGSRRPPRSAPKQQKGSPGTRRTVSSASSTRRAASSIRSSAGS